MSNRDDKSWSPWTVQLDKSFPSLKKKKKQPESDCDAVTCSECPGGPRCCNYVRRDEDPYPSQWRWINDDGYWSRIRR